MQKKSFKKLPEKERLELFSIEELEGRLETAWNDVCTDNSCSDNSCNTDNNCVIKEDQE